MQHTIRSCKLIGQTFTPVLKYPYRVELTIWDCLT